MPVTPFSLEGRVAIVTGGGTGIGRAIAREFARAGADVVVASRRLEHLEPAVEEIRALGRRSFAVALDVRQEEAVQALVARVVGELGHLDIMVNNAGASFRLRPEEISANGWHAVVGINLTGVFFGCKWAGRQMLAQGRGVIINVASIAGLYGATLMAHYGAAKAGVINLTRTLATAWGRQGVRVNCVAPGPIATEGYLEVLRKSGAEGQRLHEAVAARVGLGRWGRVEEVAYPCLFLASDAASFINGETLVVDGGPAPALAEA